MRQGQADRLRHTAAAAAGPERARQAFAGAAPGRVGRAERAATAATPAALKRVQQTSPGAAFWRVGRAKRAATAAAAPAAAVL
eukprot:361208-Chlamydomonas_euryale.AAC.3